MKNMKLADMTDRQLEDGLHEFAMEILSGWRSDSYSCISGRSSNYGYYIGIGERGRDRAKKLEDKYERLRREVERRRERKAKAE